MVRDTPGAAPDWRRIIAFDTRLFHRLASRWHIWQELCRLLVSLQPVLFIYLDTRSDWRYRQKKDLETTRNICSNIAAKWSDRLRLRGWMVRANPPKFLRSAVKKRD